MNIDINLMDTIDEFKLNDSQVSDMAETVSKVLTLEIHRNWVVAATQQLHSSRNGYIRGLILNTEDVGINSITLVGQLNNMIESGCGPFDMKEGFKNSSKVKYNSKGQWYLTIPFRIGTPGIVGESEVFSGIMPQEIYDIAKNLMPTITTTSGNVINGESLKTGDIPAPFNLPQKRSVIVDTVGKIYAQYEHKSSMYEGMIRNQKTYEASTQSTYNTFRRVSENSDPLSWIHKGIKEYNLLDEALRNTDVDVLTNNTVDNILSEMGF